jgi:hypothetical protein
MADIFKDIIYSILQTKKDVLDNEADYVPYVVNKALSYHKDCVLFANEMNRRPFIDKKLQNDYLLNTVRSRKRPFNKWVKAEKSEDIACIKEYYGLSTSKAQEAIRLLSEEQLQQIKEKINPGGMEK